MLKDGKSVSTVGIYMRQLRAIINQAIDANVISSDKYLSLIHIDVYKRQGSTIGAGLSFSNEFDYTSIGANISLAQKTKNKTGEISAKISAYLDPVSYTHLDVYKRQV